MFGQALARVRRTSRRTRKITALTVVFLALIGGMWLAGFLVELAIASAVAAIVVFFGRRAREAKAEKKARIDAARGRTAWPERFGPWMISSEAVEHEGRKHPIAILAWWALFYGGPVLAIVSQFFVLDVILFLCLFFGGPLIASWSILSWWLEWQVVTDKRITVVKNVVNTDASAALLGKISAAKPKHPWFSRQVLERFGFTGYGHIIIETSAEIEPIPSLRYVRNAREVFRTIQEHLARLADPHHS